MIELIPWVRPYRGIRGLDAYGGGGYGAPRDGGARKHLGVDLIAEPGADVVSPFTGKIVHLGFAYPNSDLRSLHIQHVSGVRVKLLYAGSYFDVGQSVYAGQHIGFAQDVASYYALKNPNVKARMTNHVHGEVFEAGPSIDPTPWIRSV